MFAQLERKSTVDHRMSAPWMRTVQLILDDQLLTAATMDATTTVIMIIVSLFYKITKIVRTLWLAERRGCMRVCKHGCVM